MNQDQNSFQNQNFNQNNYQNNYQNQVVYDGNQNYYQQPNAYQEASFDPEPEGKPSKKKIFIIIGAIVLVIIIVIVLILVFKKNKEPEVPTPTPDPTPVNNYDQSLVINNAKTYFQNNNLLPATKGECTQVTLKQLNEQNLVTDEGMINSCDHETTYIKACLLPNDNYQYSIITNCSDNKYNAKYNDFVKQEFEAIPENADVEFNFMLQEKIEPDSLNNIKEEKIWEDQITYEKGTYTVLKTSPMYRIKERLWKWEYTRNLYYPNNIDNKNKVSAYYIASPSKDYINKTDEKIAYKWYVNTHKKSETATPLPSGDYTIKGEKSDPIITYSPTRPEEADYRKIENITIYRTRTATKKDLEIEYGKWQDWTDKACENEEGMETCESQAGYRITDSTWYWYTPSKKTYYPSGSTNKIDEITYYVNSPVANALKDESTKATVYKWYKIDTKTYDYASKAPVKNATKITSTAKWSSWSKYTTNFASATADRQVEKRNLITLKKNPENTTEEITYKDLTSFTTKEEVIKKAQEYDKKINSLKDLENNNKLNLVIQVNYRTLIQ